MSAPVAIASDPPPVPPGCSTLLYFGGTFDPPHRAHVELPEAARTLAGADHVLYVPAGRNPLKDTGAEATDRQRVEMLALALGGQPRASIWTRELSLDDEPDRSARAASYTVDSVRVLRSALPDACAIRLLIGADQAAQFHRWREADGLAELAEPLVMLRAPYETAGELMGVLAEHWPRAELDRWRSRLLDMPTRDDSSTDARAALSAGDTRKESAPLPEAVGRYIAENGLYAG